MIPGGLQWRSGLSAGLRQNQWLRALQPVLPKGSTILQTIRNSRKHMAVAILYLVLAGAFLVVAPLFIYFYLQNRWYVATSFERAFMYFLVFLFFPGLLLLSPFLNFRPKRRPVEG